MGGVERPVLKTDSQNESEVEETRRHTSSRLKEGAQLVDVLGPDEFEHDHLPGAINVPLKELDKNAADQLDRTRPVLVYCNDFG